MLSGMLIRICSADFTVPGTNILIKKNDLISIPVAGIHHDPGIRRLQKTRKHEICTITICLPTLFCAGHGSIWLLLESFRSFYAEALHVENF